MEKLNRDKRIPLIQG